MSWSCAWLLFSRCFTRSPRRGLVLVCGLVLPKCLLEPVVALVCVADQQVACLVVLSGRGVTGASTSMPKSMVLTTKIVLLNITFCLAVSTRDVSFLMREFRTSSGRRLYGLGGPRLVSAPGLGCFLHFLSLRLGSGGGASSVESSRSMSVIILYALVCYRQHPPGFVFFLAFFLPFL